MSNLNNLAMRAQTSKLFQRMDEHEVHLCRALNKYASNERIRFFFAVVSRLGNGVFWYTLMLLLPFMFGYGAWQVSLKMAITGALGVALYKLLKNRLVRERPYIHHDSISQGTTVLDYYSFPSGHTLHAFSFSVIALATFPELAILLIPFTLLVALSRVVLGLHYPTDVGVGAALGTILGIIALSF